ncbi:L-serine ammonia-lyase [Phenylobacterium sp.]|jgi:L-serine dehydratase|uniref:L-serine ammonia-lyase n=1 Tax=Phenylobacterium sp. TaxID=1871053 RepID=UPI002E349EEF|nr:L-serine ammonia-lyase [Phenylobacterium sp.]HEX3363753.1 L-serine ammonia-lyase [Phenylobacterium sp.]
MNVSVFDLFKLGIGPSSSHTMGPMTAAGRFLDWLGERVEQPARVQVTLYASLALTGRGHATDRAVILGLSGFEPRGLDPDVADQVIVEVRANHWLNLGGRHGVAFDEATDLLWEGRTRLPQHPNGLKFSAFDRAGGLIAERTYFSIGGGFVRDEGEMGLNTPPEAAALVEVPYPFDSGEQLLAMAAEAGLTFAEVMRANERVRRTDAEIDAGLDEVAAAMYACIDRGMKTDGVLPGGLKVQRRAFQVHQSLISDADKRIADPLAALDWVNLWALAVNEENAAGGRVVTAPTNGAAGLVPAVLRYYDRFHHGTAEGRRTFLLTAAAIGALYKKNASISGAEVGCQGEVGVACSMAAAGLTAALGATNAQIENAAEIGMEHNLGLTCDPIGGLVQIPCIERNAMGAVKAIDASRLALLGDGQHSVSLDKVIATMKRTGEDMSHVYKETSLGGLAVNLAEC